LGQREPAAHRRTAVAAVNNGIKCREFTYSAGQLLPRSGFSCDWYQLVWGVRKAVDRRQRTPMARRVANFAAGIGLGRTEKRRFEAVIENTL
jgi:hypothetical protein